MGCRRSAAARILSLKTGLAPIARADARVLILGSLPGDTSLAARQYYAHSRNQFWKLVSEAIQQDLVSMEYARRIAELHSAGIALWDVIGAADRQGSLDQKIRSPHVNDLLEFIAILPQLRVVAFNGKKAAALAGNALEGLPIDFLRLPSSSAAYTLEFQQKASAWSELSIYLIGSTAGCSSGEQISNSEV